MGDDNQFHKQKNKFHSDFMEHFDAKVNHILEMISNMQEHLQAQERNKGEEIRNDLSVANPQLHKLPLNPQKIEIELECLSLNPSSLSFNSQNTKLEDEGFVEVPIHTTVVELQFEESKSEAENQSCNTLKLDVSPQEIQLGHQVVTSTTNLEAISKGVDFFIGETTKGEVQKVFDEMTELKMEVVCEFGMKETKLKVFDYLTKRNFDPGGNAIFEVAGKFGNEWCSKNCSRIIFSHDSDQELYEGLFAGLFNPPHLCYYNNDGRFSNEDSYKMFNYYGCDRSVLGIFHPFPFYRSSYQGYVGYGQFKTEEKEGKLEFSDYRVKGVNPFLFSCSNMSGSSKEELFIEELVKIFGKSEVEEKCKNFSSLHTSWRQLKQDGRIGNTNMLILCREITKAELGLIWATGTYEKANPNGPWQQEGKSNILWRMWEKKGIKILCIQSATVRPSSPNCCDDSLQPYIISMRVNHKIEFNKWSSIMCDSLEAVELSTLCQKIPQHIRAWRQKTIELYILGKEKMSNRRNSLIIASNIAVIKDVEAFTDPAYFSAVRFVVSTIPFLPFILKARDDAEVRSSGLELGLWVSLGYLGEALGLVSADAGRASFISLFTVIVIPLLESLLGETVPARTWFGILMSVVGISMLECSGSPPNIGDLFNFLSAIFFGIHTLRTEQISKTTRKENFLALLGYEVVVVAILSTVWCLMGSNLDGIQENDGISWTWACFWDWVLAFPWMPALYTGVFSTGLCLWGEIAALRDVSATETAVIYGLEPLWGAGFAWFLLGERWGLAGWIGAALILGGSLSVQILGASSNETREVSNGVKENESLMGSNKNTTKKTMSVSPVMVRTSSRHNVIDILKK